MFVDYDPAKHAGQKLYAIESAPVFGDIVSTLREVTDPEEIAAAASVPWFYVVEQEDTGES